ncbi:MAG: alpha/beta fold hydrolase [Burkholderiales bacterium]
MATHALIPGGGGDPWEWHRLVPELASRGHHAIAVRLPDEDDTAAWSEYADAVIDAIGDRADSILVAASMGGFTAPIVCTRRCLHWAATDSAGCRRRARVDVVW